MTDLSTLSDADLTSAYQGAPPSTDDAEGFDPSTGRLKVTIRGGQNKPLSEMSNDELMRAHAASPGYGSDIAKGAGVGLAKGAIGLAGIPGDIRSAILSGVEGLHGLVVDNIGLTPERAKELKDNLHGAIEFSVNGTGPDGAKAVNFSRTPTSDEIQKAIEGKTGDFYQTQTAPGKYAETAASFVPAAMLAPGRAALNAVRYGMVPGLASEAAGQASEGTGLEPYARFGAAVGAGGVAALASRPATIDGAIRKGLPDYVTSAHVDQADRLIQDASRAGVSLTWPEALSQVTKRPVLTDMQRLIESAPRTRSKMQNYFGARPQQIDQAGRSVIEDVGGPSTMSPSSIGPQAGATAEGVVNDVRGAINKASEPFYKNAESVLLTQPEMAKVRVLPGFEEAAKAVREDPQLNRYVSHLPDHSVAFLNEVKKYFDQASKNAAAPLAQNPNMQRAAGYGSDARAVSSIAENKSLDYATALAVQAHAREKYLDPLLAGPIGKIAGRDTSTKKAIEVLFPSEPLANSEQEVSTAVSALAKRRPEIARQLVGAHLAGKLDEAFNAAGRGQEAAQFAGATFAKEVAGNPTVVTQRQRNIQAAIEALPGGQKTWPGVQRFLEIAQATGTRMPKGSLTAFNDQDLKGLASGGVLGGTVKTGASPGAWWTFARDKIGQWQLGQNLDQLASLIINPGAAGAFKRIANFPSGSREAQILALRLIAQGELTEKAGNSKREQP